MICKKKRIALNNAFDIAMSIFYHPSICGRFRKRRQDNKYHTEPALVRWRRRVVCQCHRPACNAA